MHDILSRKISLNILCSIASNVNLSCFGMFRFLDIFTENFQFSSEQVRLNQLQNVFNNKISFHFLSFEVF